MEVQTPYTTPDPIQQGVTKLRGPFADWFKKIQVITPQVQ
jgi:hypothetical protein